MKRVKNGRYLLIPQSTSTRSHDTTGDAKFDKKELEDPLKTAPQLRQ
jgi:hypothetical protein